MIPVSLEITTDLKYVIYLVRCIGIFRNIAMIVKIGYDNISNVTHTLNYNYDYN